jgi:hypothetical protein
MRHEKNIFRRSTKQISILVTAGGGVKHVMSSSGTVSTSIGGGNGRGGGDSATTTTTTASRNTTKRQSLSTIESSVTRLLVSTKHLLESLTQWAREQADDKFVSDAYVKLGNDFRAATRAFTSAGIDITDIGDVPQALRIILEAALSEAPSQENLDRFLPNIRNIIVTLLQNLKNKQLRAKTIVQEKQEYSGKGSSSEEELVGGKRGSGGGSGGSATFMGKTQATVTTQATSRPQSTSPSKSTFQSASSPTSTSTSASSSTATATARTVSSSTPSILLNNPHRDPSVEALAQLQKGSHIQRRASKRFSAYQYAKLTNGTSIPTRISSSSSAKEVPNFHPEESSTTIEENVPYPVNDTPQQDEDGTISIFLRIGTKTRKVTVKLPVTFASLRLLFVEKFAYSPGIAPFPEIYIEDRRSGVSYELEEHLLDTEVRSGSVLCLHEIDHQASTIKDLTSKIQALTTKFDGFSMDMTSQIKDAISSIEPATPPVQQPVRQQQQQQPSVTEETTTSEPMRNQAKKELNAIASELKALKYSQMKHKQTIKGDIADISNSLKLVKESGFDDPKSSHRSYMESCHGKLSEESDLLLTKVDDLQDIMEALRKDVAQRGVRVGEIQLKHTQKDIEKAKSALKQMSQYINSEKATWKKIWEAELDKVCEEQQFFNLQDDLTQDLKEDIKKIEETFALIEQCSVEQTKSGRKIIPQLPIPEPGESIHNIKDAVLSEVAALVPNHESRVEAIERAEKIRQREREMMKLNKFQAELGEFVDEQKLKSSGGFEEIEKIRKEKDIENLKSSFGVI